MGLEMYLEYFVNYFLSFVALIFVLVLIHELGHYIFAKIFKVKVEAFSVGFGREIFSFYSKSGTKFILAMIPLGGYVKMKGEMIEKDDKKDIDSDTFYAKKIWQKFLIIFAGPAFNFIFAFFIFLAVNFFVDKKVIKPVVDDVMVGSPLYKILQKNDVINYIAEKEVKDVSKIKETIFDLAGKEITVGFLRKNKDKNIEKKVKIKVMADNVSGMEVGKLGVLFKTNNFLYVNLSFKEAFFETINQYKNIFYMMYVGLKRMFLGKASMEEIGGPIKIAEISGDIIKENFTSWVFLIGMISINLGIINLLPIPALDGSYLIFYLIEAVSGRKIPYKFHNFIIKAGFLLLISLSLLVTFKDVFLLFKE
jgi:regulator of sigma E protease